MGSSLLPIIYRVCIFNTVLRKYFVTDEIVEHPKELSYKDSWSLQKKDFLFVFYADIERFEEIVQSGQYEISRDNKMLTKEEIGEFLFYLKMVDK